VWDNGGSEAHVAELDLETESQPSLETRPRRPLPAPAVLGLAALAGLLAGAIPVQLVLRDRSPEAASTAAAATAGEESLGLDARARAGNPRAMIELALSLWQCAPAERDLPAARAWLARAAESDPRGAQGRRATRLLGELGELERNLRFDASSAELGD
jgi:hypothetical protein